MWPCRSHVLELCVNMNQKGLQLIGQEIDRVRYLSNSEEFYCTIKDQFLLSMTLVFYLYIVLKINPFNAQLTIFYSEDSVPGFTYPPLQYFCFVFLVDFQYDLSNFSVSVTHALFYDSLFFVWNITQQDYTEHSGENQVDSY